MHASRSRFAQGLIQTWADPAIAADNNGLTLPPQQILPAYRYTASGTNAVFSQYFATVSPAARHGQSGTPPRGCLLRNSKQLQFALLLCSLLTESVWCLSASGMHHTLSVLSAVWELRGLR